MLALIDDDLAAFIFKNRRIHEIKIIKLEKIQVEEELWQRRYRQS